VSDGARVVFCFVFLCFFLIHKVVRPTDADKIANSDQHPKCSGTAAIEYSSVLTQLNHNHALTV